MTSGFENLREARGAGGEKGTNGGPAADPPPRPQPIAATPFVWRDPATIPKRQWIYSKHYIRQFLSATFAGGGGSKSTLMITEALAIAPGKPLLGITPEESVKVWYWNGEDPAEETERRVVAAMQHFNVSPSDIAGQLFIDSGRKMPLIIATQTRNKTVIHKPVIDGVTAEIRRHGIGLLIIDPFVKSHRVNENDNSAIDEAATQWSYIADATGCAIGLAHHVRKTNGVDIALEDGRGASALLNATRAARVLNRMSTEEAEKVSINSSIRWRYFRVDPHGKSNLSRPSEKAEWHMLESVALANGDEVGVVTSWRYPQPLDGITADDLRKAQQAIDQGGPWRADVRATMWAGKPIARALGLYPIDDKAVKAKVAALLKTWIKDGIFVVVPGKGNDRHDVEFVEVGQRV